MSKKTRVWCVSALWVLSVAAGLAAMLRYQFTPGPAATPPQTDPQRTERATAQAKGKLLVFFHPQCGCSLATVSELERLMTKAKTNIEATAYFYKPADQPDTWCTDTNLWQEAKHIPGIKQVIDPDGKAAKSYGARCSGQILLYAAKTQKLVFSGGITESRGHEGAGAGEEAILKFAQTGVCPLNKADVYGCALW